MQVSKLMAAVLATTLCAAAHAEPHFTPSETSVLSAAVIVSLPFSLVYAGSEKASRSLSGIGDHSRWKVTEVKRQPDGKTEARMRCDDVKADLTMTLQTPTANAQRLAVGDALDVDRVGTTGYVVKKGAATIGVLAQPGMTHSKARS